MCDVCMYLFSCMINAARERTARKGGIEAKGGGGNTQGMGTGENTCQHMTYITHLLKDNACIHFLLTLITLS